MMKNDNIAGGLREKNDDKSITWGYYKDCGC